MEFPDPSAGDKRALSMGGDSLMANTMELEAARPAKKRASNPQAANQRHIKTEQARRDKIAAGFLALQELLPGRERVEKAMLLSQAANYISQLQAVLQAIMTNGSIGKLSEELQWQIRTSLPRRDAPPRALGPDGQPMPIFAPPHGTDPAQQISSAGAAPPPGLNLPFVPLIQQGNAAGPAVPPVSQAGSKEMSKDENVLVAQVQAQLQQIQQQAAAAQQMQTWQQAIQAMQLQQALNQQQQQGSSSAPDASVLANLSSALPVLPVPVPKQNSPPEAGTSQQPAVAPRSSPPEGTFTELLARDAPAASTPSENAQSGSQQVVGVASGNTDSKTDSAAKARKGAVKGRKAANPAKPLS